MSGILAPTGTPVDRVVHVSMEAIEAIHLGWETGAYSDQGNKKSAEQLRKIDLSPKAATAIYVGLNSRMSTFSLQRWINTYTQEPVMAILPGVVFGELWSMIGNIEKVLLIISIMVILTYTRNDYFNTCFTKRTSQRDGNFTCNWC